MLENFITIPSKDISLKLQWDDIAITIEKNEKSIDVFFDGNINFTLNGEVGIVSNKNIHIDTINSNIHLNSRTAPLIKDLQECVEYREKTQNNIKKQQLMIDHEHNSLIKRIEFLENKIKSLTGI